MEFCEFQRAGGVLWNTTVPSPNCDEERREISCGQTLVHVVFPESPHTKMILRSSSKKHIFNVILLVDATRLGAWLRSGEGIGWLAAGIIPNTLYRVPFFCLFSGRCILLLLLSFCRFCFVSLCFLLLSLELRRCFSDLFLSNRPRTGLATTYNTGTGYG